MNEYIQGFLTTIRKEPFFVSLLIKAIHPPKGSNVYIVKLESNCQTQSAGSS